MADKFVDKIKFFMGLDSYEDDEGYDEEDTADEVREYTKAQPTASSLYSTNSNVTPAPTVTSNSITNAPSKVVNINKNTNASMRVVLHQPKEFDDTRTIVDSLKDRRPVIINIEPLDNDLARKIFDFCSGALYALDGTIQQVSRGIFILAPNNVDIAGDVKTELESKGIFSWSKKE